MVDFWEGSTKVGIPQAIKALQNKPYVYGTVFLPHDSEARSGDTGKTRLATCKSLWPAVGISEVPKLPVDDGIATDRAMFSRLWVDEKRCSLFLDYIAQYHQEWDENRGMFVEKPYDDFTSHAADVHATRP